MKNTKWAPVSFPQNHGAGGCIHGDQKSEDGTTRLEMMAMISSSPRLKREKCRRTKHDSIFSGWKVHLRSSPSLFLSSSSPLPPSDPLDFTGSRQRLFPENDLCKV